jgi:hypothetical protein
VVLMTEWGGLRTGDACISDVWRTLNLNTSPQCEGSSKNANVDRGTGNYISAAMENLHRSEFFSTAELACSTLLLNPIVQPDSVINDENKLKEMLNAL